MKHKELCVSLLSLATGQALVVSRGPGYVTTEAWGANYSEGTAAIYPCKFVAEHHQMGKNQGNVVAFTHKIYYQPEQASCSKCWKWTENVIFNPDIDPLPYLKLHAS